MAKERANFSLDDELASDLEALSKAPPKPVPTAEQKAEMRQVSEKLGFPSREPRVDEVKPKEATQKMTLVIPAALHREFKLKTTANGEKMTDVMIGFMREYLEL